MIQPAFDLKSGKDKDMWAVGIIAYYILKGEYPFFPKGLT